MINANEYVHCPLTVAQIPTNLSLCKMQQQKNRDFWLIIKLTLNDPKTKRKKTNKIMEKKTPEFETVE